MYKKSEIMKKGSYKTGQIAKLLGIAAPTVIRYCELGVIKASKNQNGHRRIEASDFYDYLDTIGLALDDTISNKKDVIYARVSTHRQEESGDLDRQIDTIKLFAINHNPKNLVVKKDIASGLNDNRKGLKSLLSMVQNNEVDRIFVNHKDRLTRFGFNYIKQICDFHNVKIIVVDDEVNQKTQSEELAEDIISLIHSFSGKLYGLRSKIKQELMAEDSKDE